MKTGLIAMSCLALAAAALWSGSANAGMVAHAEVRLAPVRRSYSPPPLGRRQGWLTITNRDWQDYTLVLDRKDKLFLYRAGQGYGGTVIPSGATITLALEKETYDLYGNNSDKLKVKVREGRTTTLSLDPFGYVGNTGLMGVVNDGDKVRNEVLFANYAPPVVVQPAPPTIIVERPPPPPPPVIINRPPVIVNRPHHRPPPPPPRPPQHRPRPPHGGPPRKDGWGFTFGFGSSR